jgi:hypothetical protein
MSAYGYAELVAIGIWMLVHSLAHLLPVFLALTALFAGLPLVSRLSHRPSRVAVRT